jgi:hypothetical protein
MLASALLLAADLSFHLGIGLGGAHVPTQDFQIADPGASRPNGFAVSLEAQLEYGYAFGAASLLAAEPGTSETASASLRAGVYLLPSPIAPYLSAGASFLHERLFDGDSPPNLLSADGVALVGEIGVTAPRDLPHGRANLYLQIQKPLFDAPPDPSHRAPTTMPVYLAGIRLLF